MPGRELETQRTFAAIMGMPGRELETQRTFAAIMGLGESWRHREHSLL